MLKTIRGEWPGIIDGEQLCIDIDINRSIVVRCIENIGFHVSIDIHKMEYFFKVNIGRSVTTAQAKRIVDSIMEAN